MAGKIQLLSEYTHLALDECGVGVILKYIEQTNGPPSCWFYPSCRAGVQLLNNGWMSARWCKSGTGKKSVNGVVIIAAYRVNYHNLSKCVRSRSFRGMSAGEGVFMGLQGFIVFVSTSIVEGYFSHIELPNTFKVCAFIHLVSFICRP